MLSTGGRGYPVEFRRRVLDLLETRRKVADVANDLGISHQTIYNWRRQDRIDRGVEAGLSTAERAGSWRRLGSGSVSRGLAGGASPGDGAAQRARQPKRRFAAIEEIGRRGPPGAGALPGPRSL